MHLDELRGLITNSTPADWHKISCYGGGTATSYRYALDKSTKGRDAWELHVDQHSQVYVYRPNINLTMAYGLPLDDDREWEDEELSPAPMSKVRGRWLDVFWAGALVDRHLLYLVDGARGMLPDVKRGLIEMSPTHIEDVGRTATASDIRLARLAFFLSNNLTSFDDTTTVGRNFDRCLERSGIIEVPDDDASESNAQE